MMKRNFIVGLTSLFIMSGNVNAQEAQADTTGVRVNPFLESWEGNPYRIPPFSRITEDDYIPALQEGIRLQDEAIRAIVENRDEATFENTILAMENSSEVLDKVEGVLFNVVEAHATPRLHEIVNEAAQMLSAQSDKVYMNPFLFRRVKRIKEQKPALDAVQQKLLDDVYREFVLGGAELDKEAQDELMQINVKLSELENTFGQNVLKATAQYELWVEDASRLEGLPEDALRRAAEKAAQKGKTGWVFGLDNPTVMPFLQYVKDADLRKEILDGYTGRCQAGSEYDNTSVVQQIVALRLRKARLLGYPDYASYALQTRMAQTPQAVYDLLDPIWTAALERAKQELAEMKQYRKKTEKYKGAFLPSD
ncbi:MAG: peptidase M3, partial [Bacteroidales bacterium]|nr:peptidase M3 [Bacteroidales bacterium]